MTARYATFERQAIKPPKLTPADVLAAWPSIVNDAKKDLGRIEYQVGSGEVSTSTIKRFLHSAQALIAGAEILEKAYEVQFSEAGQIAAALEAKSVPLSVHMETVQLAFKFRALYLEAQKSLEEIADAWQAATKTDNELFTILTSGK